MIIRIGKKITTKTKLSDLIIKGYGTNIPTGQQVVICFDPRTDRVVALLDTGKVHSLDQRSVKCFNKPSTFFLG